MLYKRLDNGKLQWPKNERRVVKLHGSIFLIKLLEEQLKQSNRQIEGLTEQVRRLTKLLYGSKTEQSKYNLPDGQTSLFDEDDDDSFSCSEHTEANRQ